ncbi:MAG: anthranilate synthase component I family protein [Alphaproteobacteria bacterium]
MSFNFSQEQFSETLSKYQSTVLFKKISSDNFTIISSFLKLSKFYNENIFLLESAENGNNKGRFSAIGLMPDQVWKCENNQSHININFANNPNNFNSQKGDVFENFREFLASAKINWSHLKYQNSDLPSICSGAFGYMNYDMVRFMERLPNRNLPDEIKVPDGIFVRPQILIIFDSLFDCALICCPVFADGLRDYNALCAKIQNVITILQGPNPANFDLKDKSLKLDDHFESNYSQEEYCKIVEKCKEYIVAGDIFQILPSQRFIANFDENLDPFYFYRSLRSINPSPFLFYFKFKDFVISGSSPEIMVSLQKEVVTIRPLAGTRARGNSQEQDQDIAKELLADEKEVAEHLMLIDLGRHDLGSVAKPNSVRVTKKMAVEFYSHVMHLSSTIEGKILDDCDAVDALIAGFPAGTVSGAPKIRAMEIIEEIEKVKRSFYAGCAGYFASNGDMETCITLRSALIKDGKIFVQTGAGVVFDSVAINEYNECINKSKALLRAYQNIKNLIE